MTCNGHDDIECLLAIKFCNSTCELPLKFQGVMIYFLLCPICFFSFLLKYILFLHEKNLYLQCHMLSLAQFSSVAQSCPTLCDTNCSMSGLLVHRDITHGLQPTGLLRPWDFPGKSTGVGCHHLLQYLSLDTV